jgi:hypothetical protein
MTGHELCRLGALTCEALFRLLWLRYYQALSSDEKTPYYKQAGVVLTELFKVFSSLDHVLHAKLPPKWFVRFIPNFSAPPSVQASLSYCSVASLSELSDASLFDPSVDMPVATAGQGASAPVAGGPMLLTYVAPPAQAPLVVSRSASLDAALAALTAAGAADIAAPPPPPSCGAAPGGAVVVDPAPPSTFMAVANHQAALTLRRQLAGAVASAKVASNRGDSDGLYRACLQIHSMCIALVDLGVPWSQITLPSRANFAPGAPCVRDTVCERGFKHGGKCRLSLSPTAHTLEAFLAAARLVSSGSPTDPHEAGSSAMHAAAGNPRKRPCCE